MPKRIVELTVADLESNRWCVYHNDEEGYDSFEFAIPDTHLNFSEHAIEIELAHFTFPDGRILKGSFDGSESFSVFHNGNWYSFWLGISKQNENTIAELKDFLTVNHHYLCMQQQYGVAHQEHSTDYSILMTPGLSVKLSFNNWFKTFASLTRDRLKPAP